MMSLYVVTLIVQKAELESLINPVTGDKNWLLNCTKAEFVKGR